MRENIDYRENNRYLQNQKCNFTIRFLGGGLMRKGINKTVCAILCVFIMLNSFQVYCRAGHGKNPLIQCDNVTVLAGSTVKITLNLMNNPGVIAMGIRISYDKSVLQLNKAQNGTVFPDSAFAKGNSVKSVPYVLLWEDGLSKNNYTKNGVLAELYFTVIDVPTKSNAIIEVTCDNGSCFNVNLENVCFDVAKANIKIKGALGDLNYDGVVNSADALKVLQYSIGLIKLDDKQIKIGDVNSDKKINSMDALKILEYSIGKIEYF